MALGDMHKCSAVLSKHANKIGCALAFGERSAVFSFYGQPCLIRDALQLA